MIILSLIRHDVVTFLPLGVARKLTSSRRLKGAFFLFLLSSLPVDAKLSREDISRIREQKAALMVEQKKLLKEADDLQKMIEGLALVQEKKKEELVNHQEEIYKTLPLLARLERANPLRMVVDPTTGQYRVRGIILMRFLISSLKRKMQQVQAALNDITVMSNDLNIKSQLNSRLLQEINHRKNLLFSLENKKIEDWTKTELERIAKEDDIHELLEESRATLSKTMRKASAASAIKGLPFRRLERPVAGKIFKNSALQNKFSPHSQGIFFETPKNAQVTAPAKGKVVFKGPFRSHAEILIIDHGEKAHTILMGMHNIDAEVGKNVYAGEKIGTMAGYGAGQPKLYLELRHQGKSIDPSPYFAIQNLE